MIMYDDFQFEKFKDIYEFDRVVNSRANNEIMKSEHASQKNGSWSGTSTYEEAEKLLTKGWSTQVEKMKIELRKYSNEIERIRVRNKPSMAGHAPIVPAAIKGVPKAMWRTEKRKVTDKRNCVHIYFNNTGSACEDSDDLIKSGMAVLKLCVLLEKKGIKTKIDSIPFACREGKSIYACGVAIKDYKQPFNLQKMAYPIAHTAIFRRQGFKWLETMENCKNRDLPSGYGKPLGNDKDAENQFKEHFKLNEEGSIYISYYDCKECKFDPEAIAKAKGMKLEEKEVR